mgnify:CR=1 FL=1
MFTFRAVRIAVRIDYLILRQFIKWVPVSAEGQIVKTYVFSVTLDQTNTKRKAMKYYFSSY